MATEVVAVPAARVHRRPGGHPAPGIPAELRVSPGAPVSAEQARVAAVGRSAALVHQETVAAAIGFLVAERRCSSQVAFGALLEVVTRTDRPLFDVAHRLVARHTRVHEGLAGLIAAAAEPARGRRDA